MKQIFDWLRGQVPEKILPKIPVTSIEQCARASCYNKMLAVIDEAEAKWEQDCCEWEHREHYANCFCKCNGIMVEHDIAIGFNFCPYCGKPIKISEVE